MEDEIITIKGEDGEEFELEIYDFYEIEGKKYAILLPVSEEEMEDEETQEQGQEQEQLTDEEAYLFRIEKDENDEDVLVIVEDEEEFNRVAAQIESMMD